MENLAHSEWRLSVMAFAALIGTFTSIFIVERELNLTFMIVYFVVYGLLLGGNVIYVLNKRRKNSREVKGE